jgi:type II secretory pathway pseudopilin PulG
MFKLFRQNHKGDTIVEVLIAIVITSTILTGAYVLTNHSTSNDRASQEHSDALSLAQSQIEALRTTSGLNAPDTCFNNAGTAITAGCSFNNDWSPCTSPPASYCYNVTVTPPASATVTPTYIITVSWNGPNGDTNKVQLYYQWFGPLGSAAFDSPGHSCTEADWDHPTTCGPAVCPQVADSLCYQDQTGLNNDSPANSENTAAHITGCKWDWGDGTSTNYTPTDTGTDEYSSCLPGGSTLQHDYCTQGNVTSGNPTTVAQEMTCVNTQVKDRLARPFPQGCHWNADAADGIPRNVPVYVPILTIHYNNGPDVQYPPPVPPPTPMNAFKNPMLLCVNPGP